VNATGPPAFVVAAGVVGRLVEQMGFGITRANAFNSVDFPQPPPTSVLAAGGTQANVVRPSFNAASHRPDTTSPAGSVHKSASDPFTKWAKKFSNPANDGTGGAPGTPKPMRTARTKATRDDIRSGLSEPQEVIDPNNSAP
jgi:hypothetical protein